jgi:hypothetical protein
LPQGLPKKIEFHLLLANLALQLANAFACGRYILHPHRLRLRGKLDRPWDLPRATSRPQRFSSAAAEMRAPPVQMTVRNPKRAGEFSCALPRDHPLDRR